jgi:solute:Na+ symporter, SSS family
VFIFLIPGMIAFALTKMPEANFSTSGDAAYTSMVAYILPHGIKGIVACGMLVALMASLASKFNAAATLFTMDFYREWYPNASGKTEVFVGRMATAVIVFMGICWVLVIKMLNSNLYEYLQSVQGYLSPAIAVLFAVGVFWKRATAPAALISFIVGVVGGFARLAVDLIMKGYAADVKKAKQALYEGTITQADFNAVIEPIRAKWGIVFDFWNMNWLYWCQILFVTVLVLVIVISLMTKAPDPKTIKYTWYGATPEEKAATKASWGAMDVVLSVIVVGIIVTFYLCFW